MASKRMIASDIFDDDFVGELNFFGRLVWIGMIVTCADDQGRMLDSSPLIRSKCFPFDKNITDDKGDEVLAKAARDGKIIRYESAGRRILQIVHWWEYQQPAWASPSKYQPPAGWVDRVRCHVAGNKIETLNWDKVGGFEDGYLEAHSSVLRSQLRNGIDEGEVESEFEEELNISSNSSKPEKPVETGSEFFDETQIKKLNVGQRDFLAKVMEILAPRRFRYFSSVKKLLDLRDKYPDADLLEAMGWAAGKEMVPGEAVQALAKAMPNWASTKAQITTGKSKGNGNGNGHKPAGENPLAAELARRKAQREQNGERIGS
jgi:hypothetical protein